jgi:glutamate synthase (NADPH) large chain
MTEQEKEIEDQQQKGLYVPELEKDACGIGMIAHLNGKLSFDIVSNALTMLENMEHRGACGCEENTGDGAGLLCQIPHELFKKYTATHGLTLPEKGKYGVAFVFLPQDETLRNKVSDTITQSINGFGYDLLFTRKVEVNNSDLGETARSTEPSMVQFFITPDKDYDRKELERRFYLLRCIIMKNVVAAHSEVKDSFYIASLSALTIIYKGQLRAIQLRDYYKDLINSDFASAVAMVHSRFSTNTVPKWELAQPFRCIAHNGEINTVRGNVNWWSAREKDLVSPVYTNDEMQQILPVCNDSFSDSGNFDAVAEFLFRSGFSMPHALMMMVPEAYHNDENMEAYKKDFYKYHETMMEPWDGPAAMCFTDGIVVGATLDRNGLRPLKYTLTDDDLLIISSESGVIPLEQSKIKYKGNLSPGKILIADMDKGKIVSDEELKAIICQRFPYGEWLEAQRTTTNKLPTANHDSKKSDLPILTRQLASGFNREDRDMILASMVEQGQEAINSMGTDIPLAVLSTQAQHICNYFKQEFAQVTNPPIDPLREAFYMTNECYLGKSSDVLNIGEEGAKQIYLKSPVLSTKIYNYILQGEKIGYKIESLNARFNAGDATELSKIIAKLCQEAEANAENGVEILIIDNTQITAELSCIPSLLIAGAVHQHLMAKGLRRRLSILVNGADIIEPHHVACLLSFGADAVYPSLAIETVIDTATVHGKDAEKAVYNYIKAIDKGLLKVISKLGISTINSYKGAQTFEALGIHKEVIDVCFKKTVSRIGGMTFDMLAKEQLHKHYIAFSNTEDNLLETGKYQWKQRGEFHLFNPVSVHLLQHSTRTKDYELFKKYTQEVNNQSERACTLRSLLSMKKTNQSIPLDLVEPIEKIMKRFASGAMSFGSISEEAHTTLAMAMNRIGGKSNSGEGGEDSARYKMLPNGDSKRSAIKQVASGRFGVTIEYLNNADEIQIKMAQGAKPGEGGQLPGHKVDANIARIRHSTEGVGLISPPPHHDIYSIEDLAQLIFDLKNANPNARISVKLVAKAGVGIIASGVAKAHADHILISGHDGGTGASPLSSIMHAGIPWELGLAETHQTLVKNKLRDRVTLQTDGQIRTAKDMAVACMLGAEEWGIATAALVVSGCILMRKCHLNTCPVGVATQDPELRAKYSGKVEYLVNYFTFLATELREIMAELGFRTVNEMVGRSDLLNFDVSNKHWKYKNLDLSPILYQQPNDPGYTLYKSRPQDHGIDDILDRKLIQYSELAIHDKVPINTTFPIINTDRSTGTMLSSNIAKLYGSKGLEKGAVNFMFRGSAGQSFGAFGINGLHFTLEGEANDYLGKGLSGATLVVTPDRDAKFVASENIIVGNVALFGATSGEVYVKGRAGERFAVRNSGANAVVEGVGDNGCEYMTGGLILILGNVGKNFAAGMSGGICYTYDNEAQLNKNLNREMVIIDSINDQDFACIRSMIREHFRHTGSTSALDILINWEACKNKFSKVIPTEYKAILEKQGKLHPKEKLESVIA